MQLTVNAILQDIDTGKSYRVLFIKDKFVTLISMDVEQVDIFVANGEEIMTALAMEDYEIIEEESRFIPEERLTHAQHDLKDKLLKMAEIIDEAYGPTYLGLYGHKPKPEIQKLMDVTGWSKTTVWKWIRRYLQSGRDVDSLITPKDASRGGYGAYRQQVKGGRPSESGIIVGRALMDEDYDNFADALEYYKGGRARSIQKAYLYLINKFYSTTTVQDGFITKTNLAANERPSEGQFRYYCKNHLTREEIDRIKTSAREQRNNKRLLLSDVMANVRGPGSLIQMDELECDVSLRSEVNEEQVIGRAILYIMIDVYSRMIVSYSIAFDNNSVIGMTNCLLNLARDKKTLCEAYGLMISDEMWPSKILPQRISVDRGSEYISNDGERILTELRIDRELLPPGLGSLKGTVEQFFHQIQAELGASVENKGQITKRYDSKHHKQAVLTISEFEKMVLNYIIYHNSRQIDNYPMTKDMVKEGIKPVPVELWKYGCKEYGCPRPIPNISKYIYTLMIPQKAKLSRKGIECNGLFYISDDPKLYGEMYDAGNKKVGFECRIDPRDVGAVYYYRDGKLIQARLNDRKFGNCDYAGITLVEWQKIRKHISALKKEGKIRAQEAGTYLTEINEMIVKNAAKMRVSVAELADMRPAREMEKRIAESKYLLISEINKMMQSQIGEGLPDELTYAIDNIEPSQTSTIIAGSEAILIPETDEPIDMSDFY